MLGLREELFTQKIRFKDEHGNDFPEWESMTLGDVLIKNSERNKEQKYSLVQSVSNKFGFINQDEMFENRKIASTNTSNYFVIRKGCFAYNPSRIDVGSLAHKTTEDVSIISPLYISFFGNHKYINNTFLLNWFYAKPFLLQMHRSFEGSVRNTLSYEALIKIDINVPSLKEQSKIANCLTALSDKIETEKNLLAQYEIQKKYLLQQLFV
jgi:type I restriction enzyme S subunit